MEDSDRLVLVRNLGSLYNEVWDDEAARNRFVAEPRTVLAEHGIELPANVSVEAKLVENVPDVAEQGTLDVFFAEWNRMIDSGTVELKVPASRPTQVTTTELSDDQLQRVSGGTTYDAWDYVCYWLLPQASG